MGVFVVFDNMQQCCESEIQRLLPLLSHQRRERTLAYKFLSGQYCCAKSYELLLRILPEFAHNEKDRGVEQSLRDWTGEFVFNEHEKPFLQSRQSGEAISNIDFNLSHCAKGIALAIDNLPIGIDIESFRNPSEALLKRTMNVQEIQQIEAASQPDVEFTRLWTQKEALLKLMGTGIVDDLHAVLSSKKQEVTIQTTVNAEKGYVWSLASMKAAKKIETY